MGTTPDSNTNNLLEGPVSKALLLFAMPTLLSSILQSASGSMDAIWVGQLIGSNALAATANGNILMFLLTSFVFGFGMASTIYIGQAFGKSDINRVREITGTAIGTFIPICAAIAITGWWFTPQLLVMLGTPIEIAPLAQSYLQVIFLNMPAMLIFTLVMMALRGGGDSRTPLIFVILSVVLNIVISPVLIAGIGPAPELGISGAALGTLIANYTALILLLGYIYRKDLPIRLKGKELLFLVPNVSILKLISFKGLPIGLQMIVVSVAALTMLRMINAIGLAEAAAYAAAQQIWAYVQMPAMALGAAVSAMAAQNIGADQWQRVELISRQGVIFNLVLTGLLALLVTIVASPLLTVFLANDPLAVVAGERILKIASWGFVPFGIAFVLFGTMRANGQVYGPLIVLVIALFPVRIGIATGGEYFIGTDAIWWSFPLAFVITGLLAIALFRYGGWREGQLLPVHVKTECRLFSLSKQPPESASSALLN